MLGFHLTQDVAEVLCGAKNLKSGIIKLYKTNQNLCVQVFLSNPYSGAEISTQFIFDMYQYCGKLYVHSSYVAVLSTPRGRIQCMKELAVSSNMRADGLVIHLQNKMSFEETLTECANLLEKRRVMKLSTKLIFEHVPVKQLDGLEPYKSNNFETAEKLQALANALLGKGYSYAEFGICIDTAHIWCYGNSIVYVHEMKKWMDGFTDPRCLALIHLNDCRNDIGGADEHEIIGLGKIWPCGDNFNFTYGFNLDKIKDESPGFLYVLAYAKKHNIDIILERSKQAEKVLNEWRGLLKLYDK